MNAELLLRFHDVEPLPVPEADIPVINIKYRPDYARVMGLLYAVMEAKELSERALELTEAAICASSSFYSAWHYRLECLRALGRDYDDEWTLCSAILGENPKNYQLWNYRRCIAEAHPDPARNAPAELEFADAALSQNDANGNGGDAKNYHAWQHRMFIVSTYGDDEMLGRELLYTDGMLQRDVRNNSAWNQRMLVMKKVAEKVDPPELVQELVLKELAFVEDTLDCAARNASAWNYAEGLLGWDSLTYDAPVQDAAYKLAADVLEKDASCAPALAFLAAHYERLAVLCDSGSVEARAEEARAAACQLYNALIVVDPLRTPHWHRMAEQCLA